MTQLVKSIEEYNWLPLQVWSVKLALGQKNELWVFPVPRNLELFLMSEWTEDSIDKISKHPVKRDIFSVMLTVVFSDWPMLQSKWTIVENRKQKIISC